MATKLTNDQYRALRWLADFPSHHAEGQVDGNPIRRGQKPDSWNTIRVTGKLGSIVIPVADWRVLSDGGFLTGCLPDKIYGASDAGLSALKEQGDENE